jgi:hypothetical protein
MRLHADKEAKEVLYSLTCSGNWSCLIRWKSDHIIRYATKHHDFVVTHFVQWGQDKLQAASRLGCGGGTKDVYSNLSQNINGVKR